jgi:hypothetical protein
LGGEMFVVPRVATAIAVLWTAAALAQGTVVIDGGVFAGVG